MSVNIVTDYGNGFYELPTLDECVEAVKELVSKEIYNKRLNLLAENGIYLHTFGDVNKYVQNLFIDKYVEHGVHGYFDSEFG